MLSVFIFSDSALWKTTLEKIIKGWAALNWIISWRIIAYLKNLKINWYFSIKNIFNFSGEFQVYSLIDLESRYWLNCVIFFDISNLNAVESLSLWSFFLKYLKSQNLLIILFSFKYSSYKENSLNLDNFYDCQEFVKIFQLQFPILLIVKTLSTVVISIFNSELFFSVRDTTANKFCKQENMKVFKIFSSRYFMQVPQ